MATERIIQRLFTWRTAIIGSDLAPTTRHVLLTLSLHMSEAGNSCFPTVQTLCKETGLGKTTVIKQLKIAEECGWLIKQVHGYSGQGWRRHEYVAKCPDVVQEVNNERGSPTEPCTENVVHLPAKGGSPNTQNVVREVDLSSSVNSTVNSTREYGHKNGKSKKPLPEDFRISERVQAWAKRKSVTHLEDRLEDFILKAGARGYKYVDWDLAFMSAIRDDWAGLNQQGSDSGPRSKPLAG